MNTMPLRNDIETDLARTRQILRALPAHPCFAVDRELLTRLDLDPARLAYAYWPGHRRTGPCALLAVSFDPARLPVERWRWERPPKRDPAKQERLESVLGAAFVLAAKRLGRTRETGERLSRRLLEFGIDRDRRSYTRDRDIVLTSLQRRVADVIGRALAHSLDPKPLPGIHWTHHPLKAPTVPTPMQEAA
jgi:hypothetical protein